jgi:hypothetical protein
MPIAGWVLHASVSGLRDMGGPALRPDLPGTVDVEHSQHPSLKDS